MNVRTDPAQLNALLDFADLPRFDAITPDAVQPAIDTLLALSLIHISQGIVR